MVAQQVVCALLESGVYRFCTSCVAAHGKGPEIREMVEAATEVTYREFMAHVPLRELMESGIGEVYYWTDRQLAFAGLDPDEYRARMSRLRLKDDYAVRYYKSHWMGKPCYFMDHSAIQYIFVKS